MPVRNRSTASVRSASGAGVPRSGSRRSAIGGQRRAGGGSIDDPTRWLSALGGLTLAASLALVLHETATAEALAARALGESADLAPRSARARFGMLGRRPDRLGPQGRAARLDRLSAPSFRDNSAERTRRIAPPRLAGRMIPRTGGGWPRPLRTPCRTVIEASGGRRRKNSGSFARSATSRATRGSRPRHSRLTDLEEHRGGSMCSSPRRTCKRWAAVVSARCRRGYPCSALLLVWLIESEFSACSCTLLTAIALLYVVTSLRECMSAAIAWAYCFCPPRPVSPPSVFRGAARYLPTTRTADRSIVSMLPSSEHHPLTSSSSIPSNQLPSAR